MSLTASTFKGTALPTQRSTTAPAGTSLEAMQASPFTLLEVAVLYCKATWAAYMGDVPSRARLPCLG